MSFSAANPSPFERLLTLLRGAGEETRLRILRLLSRGELTVGEIAEVLGQSQPRVSRHLKVLVDAGLVVRFREGASSLHRRANPADGVEGAAARALFDMADAARLLDDPVVARDCEKLATLKEAQAEAAAAYFAARADDWDELRASGVDVETAAKAVAEAFGGAGARPRVADLGAGVGRMLAALRGVYESAVALDLSPAMLRVARANFEQAGLGGVQARAGDLTDPPLERASFDGVLIHQVLHYLEDPGAGLAAAAALMRPDGRLVIVDLKPHEDQSLQDEHLHRRLGFSDEEMARLAAGADLAVETAWDVAGEGPLGVRLWRLARTTDAETAATSAVAMSGAAVKEKAA